MPLVVCHVDQAPQMLVPAYLCQWYGGSQHPWPSRPRGGDLLLGHPRFPSFISWMGSGPRHLHHARCPPPPSSAIDTDRSPRIL